MKGQGDLLGRRLQNFRLATTLGAVDPQTTATSDLMAFMQPVQRRSTYVCQILLNLMPRSHAPSTVAWVQVAGA